MSLFIIYLVFRLKRLFSLYGCLIDWADVTCMIVFYEVISVVQILDEETPNKNMIIFLDNGKGMTSRQLNNWAIYRLSKFIRKDSKGHL